MYYKNKPLNYELKDILKASAKVKMKRIIKKVLKISVTDLDYNKLEKIYNNLIKA